MAVLWLQTSGEGPVCAKGLTRDPPKGCPEEPPQWVIDVESPPKPTKHKGPLAGAIILAILALLLSLIGGLVAGLALLGAAAGTGVATSETFWKELRCILYWTRRMVAGIEDNTREFLRRTTLGLPLAHELGSFDAQTGAMGPARDSEGRALTRAPSPDALYPRRMDDGVPIGTDATPEQPPDLHFDGYPEAIGAEEPAQTIWPTLGTSRYPDFAVDGGGGGGGGGGGAWPLQNGGMMEPVAFPFRPGGDGLPLFFGNATDNAVAVIRAEAAALPDYNLDADRGYGWLAWQVSDGLPSAPPFETAAAP
jgi:hypothetical protein